MNNRRKTVILALAVLLCGLLAFHGAEAEEDADGDDTETMTIDLTKGMWKSEDGDFDYCFGETEKLFQVCGTDLDGDGEEDFRYTSYDGGFEEGSWYYASTYIYPTNKSKLSGTYTLSGTVDGKKYRCTFILDNEPVKEVYSISIEGGRVEQYNRDGGTWEVVSQAAPGTLLYLRADAKEGNYVHAWKEDYYSDTCIVRAFDNNTFWTGLLFFMPSADVSFIPDIKTQTPYTIDMTKGFCEIPQKDYHDLYDLYHGLMSSSRYNGTMIEVPNTITGVGETVDLDGDGTRDFLLGYCNRSFKDFSPESLLLIPLSTSSIEGEYVSQEVIKGPNWPFTFRFPEKEIQKEYDISVIHGHAINVMTGETVTKAASGTLVELVYDESPNCVFNGTFVDTSTYPIQMVYGGKENRFFMPACDASFAAEVSVVEITPIPTPTEVTPTPTEQSTPTPTEQPVTPVPTEEQKVTEPATSTIAPTGTEPVKDETKQVKGEDKEQKGGFNLLYVIIPITVIILGAAIAAYVMMNRKQPAKPAQKETIDEGEDDYE